MKISKIIEAVFLKTHENCTVTETFREYKLEFSLPKITVPTRQELLDLINAVDNRDEFCLDIVIEENVPIALRKEEDISDFIKSLNDEDLTEEYEKIILKVSIDKSSQNSIINIYELEAFEEFLYNLPLFNILKLLSQYLNEQPLVFKLKEEGINNFHSNNIYFVSDNSDIEIVSPKDRTELLHLINDNCHFGNSDDLKFSPHDFYLEKRNPVNNKLNTIFDRLCLIFSIISIYDVTSLIVENKLSYKLNGYKVHTGKLDYKSLDISSRTTYYKIFKWIYSNKGNIYDKIGLARNIISINIQINSINIIESTFFSINSSFRTYLQENLNKYIEIRTKISEQLLNLSNSISKAADKYLESFQKSIFTFSTFFASVFIIRILNNGDIENVLTKDATLFSFCFLGIAFLYLLFSLWELKTEKEQLKLKYDNLKNRYKDLLVERDIMKILNNDKDFNDYIKFLNSKKNAYTIFWIIILLGFLAIILSLSTFFNWDSIF